MKVIKAVGISIASILLVLFLVNILFGGIITSFVESTIYYNKSDINYVSKEFNVRIDKSYQVDKSFTFYCTRLEDDTKCYIILDYPTKDFYVFGFEDGITEADALRKAKNNGYETNRSDLLFFISDPYSDERPTKEDLKWLVFHDSMGGMIFYDFIDGKEYVD